MEKGLQIQIYSNSKRQRNQEKFAADLIHPKPFTSRYVEHGLIHEPVATEQYEKIMFAPRTPLKVLKSGFVVCSDMLLPVGSPDDRVGDFGCHYCSAPDVKCPVTNIKSLQ